MEKEKENLAKKADKMTEDNKSEIANLIREQNTKIENLTKEKSELEAKVQDLTKKDLQSQITIRELSQIATKGLAEENTTVEKDTFPEDLFLKYKKNKS